MAIKYLEKVIEEKTEAERKHLAFMWAIGGTILVVVFWFLNLNFIVLKEEKVPVALETKGEVVLGEGSKASFISKFEALPAFLAEAVDSVVVGAGEAGAKFKSVFK